MAWRVRVQTWMVADQKRVSDPLNGYNACDTRPLCSALPHPLHRSHTFDWYGDSSTALLFVMCHRMYPYRWQHNFHSAL